MMWLMLEHPRAKYVMGVEVLLLRQRCLLAEQE
jgi:hypothetical protein